MGLTSMLRRLSRSLGLKQLLSACACAAIAFAGNTASAEAGKGEQSSKQRDATPSPSSGVKDTGSADVTPETVDRNIGSEDPNKGKTLLTRFHAELGWEMHGLLVKNNLVGNGAETLFNYFYGNVTYDLTTNDKLSLTAGFERYALTDPNEDSGFRADDIVLAYNHHLALPWAVGMDLTGSLLAPTSFASYKEGLITSPRLKVGLEKVFFKYITVNPRVFGEYYWQKYTTIQGGSTPNPIGRVGFALSVSAELPQHRPLSAGVNLYTGYVWSYAPNGAPPIGDPNYGIENNPIYKTQPAQQSYGAEVYIRYDAKPIYGFSPSAQVAYAQGDPTAGYTSLLVDGVSRMFLYYPEASQVYGSFSVKY